MELITEEIAAALDSNAKQALEDELFDPIPCVKFFNPAGAGTWIISERNPDNPDILFGLCDLGMGFPELGSVTLSELEGVQGPWGLKIERDLYFIPEHTLRTYAEAAHQNGCIVETKEALDKAKETLGK